LKITRIRHEPVKRFGKDININEKLTDFYEQIKHHKIEDIICIDETSISAIQKRSYCYSNLVLKQSDVYAKAINTLTRSIQKIYRNICYICEWSFRVGFIW